MEDSERPPVIALEGRRCSRCGELKPIEEFPIKNKATGLRRVWCRDCCRAYGREHYRRNKPAYLSKSARRRAIERPKVRGLIDQYLREHPCVDCGCTDITVLEFDHRDPSDKEITVGELASAAGWPRVLREIENCDVRCANCHRRRTAQQFHWAKRGGVQVDRAQVRPGNAGRYARIDEAQQDLLFSALAHGLKKCSACGRLKPLYAFPFRSVRTGRRADYCRPCRAQYRRSHYERNRDDYLVRAKQEMKMKREDALILVYEYLAAHPCVDCGETDVGLLEFDHIDPREKTKEIGYMLGRRSLATILREIAKCEVRCANCHRRRTAKQQGWKARLAESRGRYARIRITRE